MEKKTYRILVFIIASGLLIRLLFLFFGAHYYFHRDNIFVDGDTGAFCGAFQNLLETGSFTVNPALEYGYFGRMPGYSFFVGIFYLLCGRNWDLAFYWIAGAQILMDTLAVYMIFRIMINLLNHTRTALITAALYAFYPFAIVWNPVVYAESVSVFLMLASLFFITSVKIKYHHVVAGILIGVAVLCRPQMGLLVISCAGFMLLQYNGNRWLVVKKTSIFMISAALVYGIWPARNYINHHKTILTQDLRGFYNWNEDALAFMQYVFAVKAEWEPQYSQLIHNQHVIFPKIAYSIPGDSVKLERALFLAQHCGSGISHKSGYWKAPFDQPNCNKEIKSLFDELRMNQIKHHPWNFYVSVPLQNLKKALFKTHLYGPVTPGKRLASSLLYYRSLLILAGIIGAVFMIRLRKTRSLGFLILSFFILIYLLLCAGTSVQMRNIEMRYFLPADILLLMSGGWWLNMGFEYFFRQAGNS